MMEGRTVYDIFHNTLVIIVTVQAPAELSFTTKTHSAQPHSSQIVRYRPFFRVVLITDRQTTRHTTTNSGILLCAQKCKLKILICTKWNVRITLPGKRKRREEKRGEEVMKYIGFHPLFEVRGILFEPLSSLTLNTF